MLDSWLDLKCSSGPVWLNLKTGTVEIDFKLVPGGFRVEIVAAEPHHT